MPPSAHHGLADVHELGRAGAEHVDAEQRPAAGETSSFTSPWIVAEDLAAGELAVARDADLVRDARLRQLLLGLADEADLRDREDAERERPVVECGRCPNASQDGEPALLGRGRGEAREADHVAGGPDVVDRGAVASSTVIRPRRRPRDRPLERKRRRSRPGGRRSRRRPRRGSACRSRAWSTCRAVVLVDRDHQLAEAEDDIQVAQVVAGAPRRSRGRRSRAARGRRRPRSPSRRAPRTSTRTRSRSRPRRRRERVRDRVEPQDDVVGVEDRRPSKSTSRRDARLGPDRDHNPLGRHALAPRAVAVATASV